MMVLSIRYEAALGRGQSDGSKLLSVELTFGLKPVFQLTARLGPASEIKFVRVTPDFVLALGHTRHDLPV
jgi:hypothetical protein